MNRGTLIGRIATIMAALPVLAYPAMISRLADIDAATMWLVRLYPAYVLVAAVCAWICWSQRRAVAAVLVALMLLTHAAMWALVCQL